MNLTVMFCQMQLPAFFMFYKQNNNKNVKKAGNRIRQSVAVKFISLYNSFFNVLSFGHFLDFKSKSFKEVSNAWGAVWTLTIWEDFKKPSATWLERLWRLHMEFVSRIRDNGLDKHLVNSRGSSFKGTSRNTWNAWVFSRM